MNYKKFLGAASAALLIVIVTFLLVPGASAQNKFKNLHAFTGYGDGGAPFGGLVLDAAGNLYGTSYNVDDGDGNVFKFAPNADGSWTETVLHTFCSLSGCQDGFGPLAGVIFDASGNLYGTAAWAGPAGGGAAFELTPNLDGSWTENVLYSFCSLSRCSDGNYPTSPLIFDQAGNLYGTTTYGGSGGQGVAFRLTPNSGGSWTESALYSFCSLTNCSDGGYPSGLVFDTAGNLYGTLQVGGNCAKGCGVLYKLAPSADGSWSESVLHKFCSLGKCRDGRDPQSVLIFDTAGNLYGTTASGGGGTCDHGCGVVFKLTPNPDGSWKEKVLHEFTGGKDGAEPRAGLIFDQAGNLYGTTAHGGNLNCSGYSGGCGVVFKLAPNSQGGWTETVLHRFAGVPGAIPTDIPAFDAAGNIYGTASGGEGNSWGSVWEIKR